MNVTLNVKDGDLCLGLDIELDSPKNLAKALAEAAVILSRGLEGRGASADGGFQPIDISLARPIRRDGPC